MLKLYPGIVRLWLNKPFKLWFTLEHKPFLICLRYGSELCGLLSRFMSFSVHVDKVVRSASICNPAAKRPFLLVNHSGKWNVCSARSPFLQGNEMRLLLSFSLQPGRVANDFLVEFFYNFLRWKSAHLWSESTPEVNCIPLESNGKVFVG